MKLQNSRNLSEAKIKCNKVHLFQKRLSYKPTRTRTLLERTEKNTFKNTIPSSYWLTNLLYGALIRVHVSEPIWLQELEYVAETIKDKLNSKLGRDGVEKIIFRLGSV